MLRTTPATRRLSLAVWTLAVLSLIAGPLRAEPVSGHQCSELWGENGELWTPHSRLPDFSHAGYHEGDDPLPQPAVVCSVRDFGAVGDGAHDDTEALRDAIAACQRGAIHIPAGRYKLTGLIVIAKPGVVLRGDGPDRTVLFFPKGIKDLAPDMSFTTSSGLITVEGEIDKRERRVAGLLEPAKRGDRFLRIRDLEEVDRLTIGQQINLKFWTKDGGYSYFYAGNPESEYIIWARQVLTITGIDGDRLEFNRPLRFDVQTRITTFEPSVTEVGIEDLAIEFPNTPYRQHFKGFGYNAIHLKEVAHCWVRNVRIRNADNGVGTDKKCAFCTVTDVVLESERMTDTDYIAKFLGKDEELEAKQSGTNSTGHHGFNIKGNDNVLTRFDIRTRFIHDITVAQTMGSVISDGEGVDLCLDHHRMAPYENLWTNIDAGAGTRLWMSTGDKQYGLRCGARETFWNIRADQPQHWPAWRSQRWSNDFLNLIAVHSDDPSVKGIKDAPWPIPEGAEVRWFENIPCDAIHPPNLHKAQLRRRLGE